MTNDVYLRNTCSGQGQTVTAWKRLNSWSYIFSWGPISREPSWGRGSGKFIRQRRGEKEQGKEKKREIGERHRRETEKRDTGEIEKEGEREREEEREKEGETGGTGSRPFCCLQKKDCFHFSIHYNPLFCILSCFPSEAIVNSVLAFSLLFVIDTKAVHQFSRSSIRPRVKLNFLLPWNGAESVTCLVDGMWVKIMCIALGWKPLGDRNIF